MIPGEWSCAVCGAQGCWRTRRSCYKCGSLKTASPVQLGAFINGYTGHLREQSGIGRPTPTPAPAPALVPVVVPPRLTKSHKKAAKQRSTAPPTPVPTGQSDWDTALQALLDIGLDEGVLGKRSGRKSKLRLQLKRKKRDTWLTFVTSGTRPREFWIDWWRMRKRKRWCTKRRAPRSILKGKSMMILRGKWRLRGFKCNFRLHLLSSQ